MVELRRDRKDLDGVNPTSTVRRTNAPPFLSHPRVGTASTDRNEEEGGD